MSLSEILALDLGTLGAEEIEELAQIYEPARIRWRPEPEYPPGSRRLKEEGEVEIETWVSAEGKPLKVRVARSSGIYRLDRSAWRALRRAIFSPARFRGQAIEAPHRVTIEFRLKR